MEEEVTAPAAVTLMGATSTTSDELGGFVVSSWRSLTDEDAASSEIVSGTCTDSSWWTEEGAFVPGSTELVDSSLVRFVTSSEEETTVANTSVELDVTFSIGTTDSILSET